MHLYFFSLFFIFCAVHYYNKTAANRSNGMEWIFFFVVQLFYICMIYSVIVKPNKVYADLLPVFIISKTLRKRKYPAEKAKFQFENEWNEKNQQPTNLWYTLCLTLDFAWAMKNPKQWKIKTKRNRKKEKNWQTLIILVCTNKSVRSRLLTTRFLIISTISSLPSLSLWLLLSPCVIVRTPRWFCRWFGSVFERCFYFFLSLPLASVSDNRTKSTAQTL